jgi:DNA-binding response OmpR family regulator
MLPAPPLEGIVVVVQHKTDVARRFESALAHAGATVFTARSAAETIEIIEIMDRYQANLIVVDLHDADGVFNEQVVFASFHRGSGRIC